MNYTEHSYYICSVPARFNSPLLSSTFAPHRAFTNPSHTRPASSGPSTEPYLWENTCSRHQAKRCAKKVFVFKDRKTTAISILFLLKVGRVVKINGARLPLPFCVHASSPGWGDTGLTGGWVGGSRYGNSCRLFKGNRPSRLSYLYVWTAGWVFLLYLDYVISSPLCSGTLHSWPNWAFYILKAYNASPEDFKSFPILLKPSQYPKHSSGTLVRLCYIHILNEWITTRVVYGVDQWKGRASHSASSERSPKAMLRAVTERRMQKEGFATTTLGPRMRQISINLLPHCFLEKSAQNLDKFCRIPTLTFMQQSLCTFRPPPTTGNAAGRRCAGSQLPESTQVSWTPLDLQTCQGSRSRNTRVHLLNMTVSLKKAERAV